MPPPSDSETDFQLLIPELADWNNGAGIDIDGWLQCRGSFELAIAFCTLFWPRFVEFDGCILFGDFSTESYGAFMQQCDGDRAAVEGVMNHRHVLDLFADSLVQEKATAAQMEYIGSVLRDMWSTKLRRDFPEREFKVTLQKGDQTNLLDYIVTFWQPANNPRSC